MKSSYELVIIHHENPTKEVELNYQGTVIASSSSSSRRVIVQELPEQFALPVNDPVELRVVAKLVPINKVISSFFSLFFLIVFSIIFFFQT